MVMGVILLVDVILLFTFLSLTRSFGLHLMTLGSLVKLVELFPV